MKTLKTNCAMNKFRIFVVDDDEFYAELLSNRLDQNENFEVITFYTGEEMLKNIDKQPDLIVMDYHLDGNDPEAENGGAIMETLESLETKIPVILLSGQKDINTAVSLLKSKASDYIVKDEFALDNLEKCSVDIFNLKKMSSEVKVNEVKKKALQQRIILMGTVCIVLLALLIFN